MKKRLQLKKVTLRDLDDEAATRIAGGATQPGDSCANTTCTLQSCCGTCGYPCGGGTNQAPCGTYAYYTCPATCPC